MNKIKRYFKIAKLVAQRGDFPNARRQYRIGAIGLRKDGVLVAASNVAVRDPNPSAHAEYKLSKKLTPKSIVFVVRITRDGNFALAKPCVACQNSLRSRVTKCYYTISNKEYGVIIF